MISSKIGEIAALTTAICWAVMGMFFESAGKRVGSLAVNFIRLVFGFLFISIFTYFVRGHFFPVDATLHNWTWLSISGAIGFFLGDLFLFQAYIEIGTRISLLILASSPPLTALLGFIFLKEKVSILGVLGMFVTFLGIALVILSKDTGERKFKFTHSIKGLIYAFLGAIGQSVGTIFSKVGMNGYNAFASTQIRIISGFFSFVILFLFLNRWSDLKEALKDKRAMILIAVGAILGPFLGVSLQLISLQYTTAGVSATIISIMPIIIIPFSIIIYKEKITAKEILGAVLSVLGVGVLFLI
ncbi:EamA-like transporter family protein [Tissierella creatinophila DSM 6911]|uniref:EamA-like transporter family protein n=1 Tax=Tissierella creatinophila DSM 6911 TaxID=1123403 RepID=A0A1U7M946_TISCR|nr:EamA-like transporter family protein [Tissierella creatinophila DSM 6911]